MQRRRRIAGAEQRWKKKSCGIGGYCCPLCLSYIAKDHPALFASTQPQIIVTALVQLPLTMMQGDGLQMLCVHNPPSLSYIYIGCICRNLGQCCNFWNTPYISCTYMGCLSTMQCDHICGCIDSL